MDANTMPKPFYHDSRVTLYHGDCREILPLLGRFDLLLTDPPYELDISQGNKGCFAESYSKLTSSRLQSIADGFDIDFIFNCTLENCNPVSAFVFCSNSQIHDILSAAKTRGLMSTLLCWHKYNSVPFSHGTWRQDAEWVVHIKSSGAPLNGNSELKSKVKRIPLVSGKAHPTEKPLGLIRDYVLIGSNEGDLVVDPYCGSGTTLVAAKLEGRHAVGIEINERYCELAAERLRQGVLF